VKVQSKSGQYWQPHSCTSSTPLVLVHTCILELTWRWAGCSFRGSRFYFVYQIALSVITDAYGKGADHADRMRSCTKIIQLMLRTWSGEHLVTCSPSKYETIHRADVFLPGGSTRNQVHCRYATNTISRNKSILLESALEDKNSHQFKEIVLDMFFDLFNIKAPQWYKTFIDGRRLTSGSSSHHGLLVTQGLVQCIGNPELLRISSQTRNFQRRLLQR
jgi:hypothetical protein